MEAFTIRDLRERTGDLVRACEAGELSVLTKHGCPLCVTVPLDRTLLDKGVGFALATRLVKDGVVGLAAGARIAGLPLEAFMEQLGAQGIVVIDYDPADLAAELDAIDEPGPAPA